MEYIREKHKKCGGSRLDKSGFLSFLFDFTEWNLNHVMSVRRINFMIFLTAKAWGKNENKHE